MTNEGDMGGFTPNDSTEKPSSKPQAKIEGQGYEKVMGGEDYAPNWHSIFDK